MQSKDKKLKRLTYQVEQTMRLVMRWSGLYCIQVNSKGVLSTDKVHNKNLSYVMLMRQ